MANQVAYGFIEHQDIFSQRIVGQVVDVVEAAIQASVDEHNRQMDALLGLFVERTTEYKRRFTQATVHRLQPLDDNGRARPIKVAGYYDVAWPIQQGGSAWGANYVARQKMTVADANRITLSMLDADMRWVRDHLLAALFSALPWTFTDEQWGDLAIEPLADGGAEQYLIFGGADTAATDTHQLGFANAINDGADNALIAVGDELREHPENPGQVVALLGSTNATDAAALDTFIEATDPNLRVGTGVTELVTTPGVALPGELLGYDRASRVWIVEWKHLPATYGIATTTGAVPPLRMREDDEAELRGFKKVAERPDHPFLESQWLRRAGFGAWNRVGAVVFETADASYDVPSGYAAPIS